MQTALQSFLAAAAGMHIFFERDLSRGEKKKTVDTTGEREKVLFFSSPLLRKWCGKNKVSRTLFPFLHVSRVLGSFPALGPVDSLPSSHGS